MTNTKWLRRALLGSVALGVMASGAQADELSDLKAQLESLQSRVNQLEEQPAQAALPEGVSLLTITRGSADIPDDLDRNRMRDETPDHRGFTIAVTPTADLPAPVAEVVIYGFVRANFSWDFDGIKADGFYVPGLFSSDSRGEEHFRAHASHSRFGIRSRVDTAIGQIRATIEGDFRGSGEVFRLRRAFGEWDMTPTWTLLLGQTQRTAVLIPIGVTTVDVSGSAGPNFFPRATQARLTYHSGPISWAVAVEDTTIQTSEAKWPNLSSYLQFDAPGGHQFIVTGTVADHRDEDGDRELGWAVQAGANINLADIATLTVGGLYGKREHCTYLNQQLGCGSLSTFEHDPTTDFEFGVDPDTGDIVLFPVVVPGAIDFLSDEGWGVLAGLSFGITDATSFNVQYGISVYENGFSDGADHVTVQTLHANVLWRPVQQMQLGWEVMWGDYRFSGGDDWDERETRKSEDALRATFGAWFFF